MFDALAAHSIMFERQTQNYYVTIDLCSSLAFLLGNTRDIQDVFPSSCSCDDAPLQEQKTKVADP